MIAPFGTRALALVLAGLMAVLPASGAMAERQVKRSGVFAMLAPSEAQPRVDRKAKSKAEKKAERQAERQAKREAKRDARKAKNGDVGQGHAASSAARAEVKAGVAHAIANRPRGRLWCVPFARTVSGVDIRGNAKTWWAQAKGVYERGHKPKIGAVMAFSASRSMPLGHVAVVSNVISDREILVDQANWERNRVTQDTLVVDVSAKGDWSKVKVANAAGTLGRVNPVNGFIYN